MTICQSELEGKDAIDAILEVVEVGMSRIDGYVILDKRDDGTAGGIGRGDALDAAEDEGMVCDNEVGAKGDGLVDNSRGKVEGYKSSGTLAVGIAEEKSRIVVVLLVFGMEFAVEKMNDFVYCHDEKRFVVVTKMWQYYCVTLCQ